MTRQDAIDAVNREWDARDIASELLKDIPYHMHYTDTPPISLWVSGELKNLQKALTTLKPIKDTHEVNFKSVLYPYGISISNPSHHSGNSQLTVKWKIHELFRFWVVIDMDELINLIGMDTDNIFVYKSNSPDPSTSAVFYPGQTFDEIRKTRVCAVGFKPRYNIQRFHGGHESLIDPAEIAKVLEHIKSYNG